VKRHGGSLLCSIGSDSTTSVGANGKPVSSGRSALLLRKEVDGCQSRRWCLTLAPPGYTSTKSALRIFKALQDGKTFINGCETWEDVEKGGFAVVGSPQTVARRLVEWGKQIGCGNLLGLFQLGNMPKEKALANAQLYAEAVKPLIDREIPDSREPMPPSIPFPKAA
jgi:hypothetical protein